MSKSHRKRQILSLGLLATLAGTAAVQYAMAASAQPVFSPTAQTAWVGIGIWRTPSGPWLAKTDRARPCPSVHFK